MQKPTAFYTLTKNNWKINAIYDCLKYVLRIRSENGIEDYIENYKTLLRNMKEN